MKVLVVHADYLEPGGETISARAEVGILRQAGHEVETYFRSNREFSEMPSLRQTGNLLYNRRAFQDVRAILRRFPADVVHCNNLFPSLSPSVYVAGHRSGAAVVQSLRNYRFACAAATFFRDGAPCFACSGRRVALPAVRHGCYRGSRIATAAAVATTGVHRAAGLHDSVDAWIVLSRRSGELLARAGVDPERMHVKYNVVSPEPTIGQGRGGYFLIAGRLQPEKGIREVLTAARMSRLPVKVIGNGQLADDVRTAAEAGIVEWIPHLPHEQLLALMREARAVMAVPTWEEPFGRTVAESLGTGTPLLVTPLGALPELVVAGVEGLHVRAGDTTSLAAGMREFAAMDDVRYAGFRVAARRKYEQLFSPATNAARLTEVYAIAVERFLRRPRRLSPSH